MVLDGKVVVKSASLSESDVELTLLLTLYQLMHNGYVT
jgi:hypothetical protein